MPFASWFAGGLRGAPAPPSPDACGAGITPEEYDRRVTAALPARVDCNTFLVPNQTVNEWEL